MQSTPRSWVQKNYTSFNGLRGIAVLMVFLNHYGRFLSERLSAQFLWAGVDLFFVLSGFLITGILVDSRDSPAYFRDFYIRRALRIFPLYYGFFLLLRIATLLLPGKWPVAVYTNLFYLENFFVVHPESHNPTLVYLGPILGHSTKMGLGALWSLCVEEHFYLIWPVVLWLLPSRRAMMGTCCVGIGAALFIRTALFVHDPGLALKTNYLYFSSYTRFDSLLVGSLLALWLREVRLRPTELRRAAGYALLGGIIPVLIGALTIGRRWPLNATNPIFSTYGYTFVAIAAAGLLMFALDESSGFSRVLRQRTLARLGVMSYGFYFFHGLYWEAAHSLSLKSESAAFKVGVIASVFLFTYALAKLSFRFWESAFLLLKDRLAPSHRSVPSGREATA